jgi:hypothetical protein
MALLHDKQQGADGEGDGQVQDQWEAHGASGKYNKGIL